MIDAYEHLSPDLLSLLLRSEANLEDIRTFLVDLARNPQDDFLFLEYGVQEGESLRATIDNFIDSAEGLAEALLVQKRGIRRKPLLHDTQLQKIRADSGSGL